MGLYVFDEGAGVGSEYSPVYGSMQRVERRAPVSVSARRDEDEVDEWRARHDFFEEY